MKRILMSGAFLCLVLFGFSQGAKFYRIKNYLLENGYTISHNLYADLKQGENMYQTLTFYPNTTYVIYGFTEDDDVNDLDIYMTYSDGTIYRQDEDDDSTPVVIFTPTYTRTLKVKLVNVDSNTPSSNSRCRFFIAYK